MVLRRIIIAGIKRVKVKRIPDNLIICSVLFKFHSFLISISVKYKKTENPINQAILACVKSKLINQKILAKNIIQPDEMNKNGTILTRIIAYMLACAYAAVTLKIFSSSEAVRP